MASKTKKIQVKPTSNHNISSDIAIADFENPLNHCDSVLTLSEITTTQADNGRLLQNTNKTNCSLSNGTKEFASEKMPWCNGDKKSCVHFNAVLLYLMTVISLGTLTLVVLSVVGVVDPCKCASQGKNCVIL